MKARMLVAILVALCLGSDCDPEKALDTLCTPDRATCVSLTRMQSELSARLDDAGVAGYAFVVGGLPQPGRGGVARTSADPPETPFDEHTRLNVASVSKTITAVALIQALDAAGVSVDDPIAPWLPPDWTPGPNVGELTFRELLTHRSGIRADGNAVDYASLKVTVEAGIDLADKTLEYNNSNFALFRIMIPYLIGFDDPGAATREQATAAAYRDYVIAAVLERAGIDGAQCRPSSPETLVYPTDPGATNGFDPGDNSLICGSTGWYLSASQLWLFLLALRDGTNLLTADQRTRMDDGRLGWFPPEWAGDVLVHNGVLRWDDGAGTVRGLDTVILVFPTGMKAVVVANSPADVWGMALDAHAASIVPAP